MSFLQVATAVLGVIVLLAATSLLLPRTVRVARSATVPTAAETVLALASSGTGYQRFNPYRSRDPGLKIEPFGPARGIGSGFHFDGKEGKGSVTVTAVTPSAVDFQIELGPMGRPQQRIEVLPVAGGTGGSRVVWTMQADMGLNPIGRVMGLFMDRFVGPTFETGLRNIALLPADAAPAGSAQP